MFSQVRTGLVLALLLVGAACGGSEASGDSSTEVSVRDAEESEAISASGNTPTADDAAFRCPISLEDVTASLGPGFVLLSEDSLGCAFAISAPSGAPLQQVAMIRDRRTTVEGRLQRSRETFEQMNVLGSVFDSPAAGPDVQTYEIVSDIIVVNSYVLPWSTGSILVAFQWDPVDGGRRPSEADRTELVATIRMNS